MDTIRQLMIAAGEAKMHDIKKTYSLFIPLLLLLCGIYLIFELYFNAHYMITVDEFWFAHRAYQYKSGLPYRDFSPYKTVLGYYFLLIPMLFTHGIFTTLITVKNVIALLNTALLITAGIWLKRYYSTFAVITSLFLLVTSQTFLTYSTNIRVDLFAYWFCFFGFLCLIEKRFIFAGILLGLGFITSQKSIWYLFACNIALSAHWLSSDRTKNYLFNILKFNASLLVVIGLYFIAWSFVAGFHAVFTNMLIDANAMYHLNWYDDARLLYWKIIISHNPLLFLLIPFTLFTLEDQKRVFVTSFAIALLICLIPYKQVFPYYMQVAFPVFLLLYANFFDWIYKITPSQKINKIIFGALLFLSIYPLAQFFSQTSTYNNQYQKANLETLLNLLKDGSDYVAGIELIYNQNQPTPGLRHLMGPAVAYLYHPTPELKKVMLASLYEDPNATEDSVIAHLEKENIKCYVNNYRIENLPPKIKAYLTNNYTHLAGSIYIYAPLMTPNQHRLHLKFSGNYSVNGHIQSMVAGTYPVFTQVPIRWVLVPDLKEIQPITHYPNDEWQKVIF